MVQRIFHELEEALNSSALETMVQELLYENPIYDKTSFDVGQTFETLLVSIKIQDHHDFQYSRTKESTLGGEVEHDFGAIHGFGSDFLWTKEFNGIDSPALIILTNASWFNISSGKSKGVEVTVDLETFNNADISQEGDGLSVILENNKNQANFDLSGFTVKPGEMATIKIFPSLYDVTPAALNRFDYKQRKCVGGGEIDLDQLSLTDGSLVPLAYSLTNCFKSAMMTELVTNCPGFVEAIRNPGTESALSGNTLACTRGYTNQIGRWKVDNKSKKQCFPSCKRQENDLTISTQRFPNFEFTKSPEFLTIAKKLFWSCQTNTTRNRIGFFHNRSSQCVCITKYNIMIIRNQFQSRFGYKRRMVSLAFPDLCGYYDQHFYPRAGLTASLAAEDAALLQFFNASQAGPQGEFGNITTMQQLQGVSSAKTSK